VTVSTVSNRVAYTGDGATTAFAVSYPFFDAADLEVIERVIASGAETVKTLTTHYTVAGGLGATGTVTAVAAPASTVQWVIRRRTAKTQLIDYTANDPFPANTHETGLDRAAMRAQDTQGDIDRALKVPASDDTAVSTEIPAIPTRKGKFLSFDATTGAPVASEGVAGPTGATGAAGTNGTNGTNGAFPTSPPGNVAPALDDKVALYDTSAANAPAIATAQAVAELLLGLGNIWTKQQYFPTATLTDAATIAWDCNVGQVVKVTLGGNRAMGAPTNVKEGATYMVEFIQDATGTRTMSYNAVFHFDSGGAPVLTTTASKSDWLAFVGGPSGVLYYMGIKKGFTV
jgi:hypothetical protein